MKPRKALNLGIFFVVVLMGIRLLFPERTLDALGPRAILDAGFALGLLVVIIVLATGMGLKTLRLFTLSGLTRLEMALFSLALGLGVIAFGVLIIGLAGFLRSETVYFWLLVAAIWSRREWGEIVSLIPSFFKGIQPRLAKLGIPEKGLLILGGLIFMLSTIQALAPPWAYDSLVYHIQAPRIFLQQGYIGLLPELVQANNPLNVELLFGVGLVFDTDVFSRLLDVTFMGLLVLGTYSLGSRTIGGAGGWLAVGIILGVPIFPIWGTLSNVDMAWAFYELMAVYSTILWAQKKNNSFLVLAGLSMGWAVSTKLLGLGGFGILGLWIVWFSWKGGLKKVILHGFLFGISAVLISSPWFIKNLILAGNPIYPFVFGGPGWDADRLEQLMLIVQSFGAGRSFWDYILLPLNLFSQNTKFGSMFTMIEFPSLLFLLALLYPLVRKAKVMNWIAALTLLRFLIWAMTTQTTRYLLPLFPLLSIVSGSVMIRFGKILKSPSLGRILGMGIIGGLVSTTLAYQLIYFVDISPLAVVVGKETKNSFLSRTVFDYDALQFAQENLSEDARILMMWDGQGYYCDERCVPDAEQFQWVSQVIDADFEVSALVENLNRQSISHLLLDTESLNFILQHDPAGWHLASYNFFIDEFEPFCTQELFRDDSVILYKIICN